MRMILATISLIFSAIALAAPESAAKLPEASELHALGIMIAVVIAGKLCMKPENFTKGGKKLAQHILYAVGFGIIALGFGAALNYFEITNFWAKLAISPMIALLEPAELKALAIRIVTAIMPQIKNGGDENVK
jgi:hypothetical protein